MKETRTARELLRDRDYLQKLLDERPQWQTDLRNRYRAATLKRLRDQEERQARSRSTSSADLDQPSDHCTGDKEERSSVRKVSHLRLVGDGDLK